MQYQCAISNIFNHPSYAYPAANISVPGSAGVISGTWGTASGWGFYNLEKADNRRVEMRLRLEW